MSRLCVLLTLCLVMVAQVTEVPAATAAAPTQKGVENVRTRWTAPQGPYFNDPHLKKGWFRVQMLLNDHQYTKAMRAIRKEIGARRSRDSLIYRCKAGCRSKKNPYNNMHTKFYSFSQAGRSKDVLAVGSANMMLNANIHQWNDLYFTSGDHELFRQFVSLFNDMRVDHDTRQPPRFFCGTPVGAACDDSVDKHTVWAYPKPSGPRNDLVLDTLAKVQCLTPDGAGGQTRTRLALSMHTMRGRRGDYLAAAIRQKYAEGCRVRVSYGRSARRVSTTTPTTTTTSTRTARTT